jgi:hypothetical protein
MQRLTTVKQLYSFLGAVNYYQDMLPRRAHILAPLTVLSGTWSLNWTPECQLAFNAMKDLMAKDTFLKYPDHNNNSIFIVMPVTYSLVQLLCKMVCLSHSICINLTLHNRTILWVKKSYFQ